MIHKYSFMLYSFNFTVLFLMLSSFCFSFLFNFSSYFHGEIFSFLHHIITMSSRNFFHSRKKRKDSLETRAILLIFSLELEISEVALQSIHQNSKKWRLQWEIAQWKWLGGCFSHFLLLWPWCYGFWGSSEDR